MTRSKSVLMTMEEFTLLRWKNSIWNSFLYQLTTGIFSNRLFRRQVKIIAEDYSRFDFSMPGYSDTAGMVQVLSDLYLS